ncbi:MAG: ATP-binding protein [Pseudomonadota bacterium]
MIKHRQEYSITRATVWSMIIERLGGPLGVLAAFAISYACLVWLGYQFKESDQQLTIMWPSAGLLFMALWLSQGWWWLIFIGLQLTLEVLVGAAVAGHFNPSPGLAVMFASANTIDAIAGATVMRLLLHPGVVLKVRHVLLFAFATAAGSLSGAVLGAYASMLSYNPLSYAQFLQIWWAGNWLGTLAILPVAYSWALPLRIMFPELRLRSRLELLVLTVAVGLCTVYVFSAVPGGAISVLQLPVILAALLVLAAFRLPPRWVTTLALMAVVIAASIASRRAGPFVVLDPFVRVVQVQSFLATLVFIPILFTMFVTELRIGMGRIIESESRYRNFVEHSSEAVWRVELDDEMPISLSIAEQRKWLEQHAHVAECSEAYGNLDPSGKAMLTSWRGEIPWSAIYEKHLDQAARQHYSMDGLRFDVTVKGRPRTFLTSFTGVVRNDHLQRIWGVARDVTELVDLNTRLAREQERLRGYARQIVTAEERARRATAVDLHDGIGQELIGMGMALEVLRAQAPEQSKGLLDELRMRLREVQERTRHMISDLSPPGLYDLGLCPALQWLAIYLRTHEKLQVELDCRVREELVDVDLRVLIFKLVRELLRNVVKHADVSVANVTVHGDSERVKVEVRDGGRGFVWELDLFGGRNSGFGLWSIEDRVREVGGEFTVDTSPGQGARFEMVLPLRRTERRRGSGSFELQNSGTED